MPRFTFFAALTYMLLSTVVYSQTSDANNQSASPWDQWATGNPTWVEHMQPFHIIGNVYFVGTKGLSSFLIASNEGHILIDGGLPQNASMIAANIRTLGFDIADVKTMLNSHAHFDHSGGLKELKDLSGAQLLASEGDRSALEGGFYLGYENNINYSAPPVAVNGIIKDGDTVALGENILTAHITPGHTRGCTSFTMEAVQDQTSYQVLFFCGATVAGNTLVPEQYDGIIDDYRHTFTKTANWQPDVWLVNHPFFFDMEAKRKQQLAGNPLAFVDRRGFPKLMADLKVAFDKRLKDAENPSDKAN